MSTAASVSKGVFVFKGKKAVANAENYFCNGDTTSLDIDRFGICNELWENINDKIQIMQCDLNTRIFEDLVTYVAEAQLGFQPGSGCPRGTQVMHEIPTAALVTGVNMPDHALMFTNLMSMLVEQVTPHVAMLRSKDCPNLKSIMAKTVSQFLQNVDLGADDDEDLPEQTGLNTRRITSTMSVLANWYMQITQRVGSPKKRRLSEGLPTTIQFPPIVIVLEDLEGFSAPVLQDFITICSNHLHELPLVLIFGIATTVTAVHRLVPFEVSSCLCMDKFQAPPAAEYLSQVISQVLLTSDIPFKLGPKVFGLLLDLFLYHDFSVLNFVRGLQFALLEHFYGSSVSCLCQPIEDAVKSLGRMSHSQVEDIRRLMSFRKHVEGCKPEEQISLLEDDKRTKKAIGQLLNQLEEYHEFYYPVLRCLHVLVCKLPKYPLGKQIREIYVTNLTCSICEMPEYEEAFNLLGSLSRNELVEMLTTCMLMLSDTGIPQDLQDTGTQLQNYLDKLDNIEELSQTHESCKEDTEDETEEEPASQPRKMDMFTLRQKLQILGKKKKVPTATLR